MFASAIDFVFTYAVFLMYPPLFLCRVWRDTLLPVQQGFKIEILEVLTALEVYRTDQASLADQHLYISKS